MWAFLLLISVTRWGAGGGEEPARGVVLRGDAGGDVVGADLDPRARLDQASCQVMVMVPALAASSETKSTACTTRTPGTMSSKRASTMSESAVAFPACRSRRPHTSGPAGTSRRAGRRIARTAAHPGRWEPFLQGPRVDEGRVTDPAEQRSAARPCPFVPSRLQAIGAAAPQPQAQTRSASRSFRPQLIIGLGSGCPRRRS